MLPYRNWLGLEFALGNGPNGSGSAKPEAYCTGNQYRNEAFERCFVWLGANDPNLLRLPIRREFAGV